MNHAPTQDDFHNESDVEQKLIARLLFSPPPTGLGHSTANVLTKHDVRHFDTGKHRKQRSLYPDYVVCVRSIPLLVVEAKHPNDDIQDGLSDACLYANSLNAVYPHNFNPVKLVLASNGVETALQYLDENQPLLRMTLDEFAVGSRKLQELIETIGSTALNQLYSQLPFHSNDLDTTALSELNVQEIIDSELLMNTFGERLNIDYRPLFTPDTRSERSHIARNAYVRSTRRDRYSEEIDKVIRHSSLGTGRKLNTFTDSGNPQELYEVLRRGPKLENQIILLVGGRGVGKTTFVDYLVDVCLPEDIQLHTSWARINLNVAPKEKARIETWVIEHLLTEICNAYPTINFYSPDMLAVVFSRELTKIEGALSIIEDKVARDARRSSFLMEKITDNSLKLAAS